jgi:hypothetical protein
MDNRKITAAQICSNERLQYNNSISYLQAYHTIQAVLTEMYGDEAESFAKFLALAERFQAAFFALASLRIAHLSMQSFISIDGTHTISKFWMTLLIASSINANGKTLPLAWALVPIKNNM